MKQFVRFLVLYLVFSMHAFADAEEFLYPDVAWNHTHADAIQYAKELGFATGNDDGSFSPEENINRAEALDMILSAFNISIESEGLLSSYIDVPAEAWYANGIIKATELGFVKGYDNGSFAPGQEITLAEALKIIFLASGTSIETSEDTAWYQSYIDYALNHGYIDIVAAQNPCSSLSRADLVEILWRFKSGLFTEMTYIEYGQATYYHNSFEGSPTASGEPFKQGSFTAAHKTLPFGTVVRVTNVYTQLSVDVVINDRGPYANGKIIDLSTAAFSQIGSLSSGVISVKIEIIPPSSYYETR